MDRIFESFFQTKLHIAQQIKYNKITTVQIGYEGGSAGRVDADRIAEIEEVRVGTKGLVKGDEGVGKTVGMARGAALMRAGPEREKGSMVGTRGRMVGEEGDC